MSRYSVSYNNQTGIPLPMPEASGEDSQRGPKKLSVALAQSRLRHRIGVLTVALAMLIAVPLAALATTKEGHISCVGPWYWPRTYSTSMFNTTHSHWMESHGSIAIPNVTGLAKTWDWLPRYGDWSVTATTMQTGGANGAIAG